MNPNLAILTGPADEVAAREVGVSGLPAKTDMRDTQINCLPRLNSDVILFDDLVGERQHLCRKIDAKRLRGSQVDDQFELCRLHDG